MSDVNIVDIAKLAGVSVSTVSRVLNNHPDVSAKTREKVRSLIKEHSYIPNDSARNLKRESLKAVAVVMKGVSNPFFTAMLPIIQQELEKHKFIMLLHQLDPKQDEVTAAIRFCKEKKSQGLIFVGGNFKHNKSKLAMLDIPYTMLTITMKEGIDRSTFSSVTIDDYSAGYSVASRMIEAGHRKIAAIGSNIDDISISRLRIDGFRQALTDHGLYNGEEQIAYAGDFTRQAGYDAAKLLLKQTEFTCLFCIADLIALGAIRALHDEGKKVPEDVSVVGFDGIDEGRFSIPSLASMRQPGDEMALKSVRILLSHIRNGTPHKHKIFEAQFSNGESFKPKQ